MIFMSYVAAANTQHTHTRLPYQTVWRSPGIKSLISRMWFTYAHAKSARSTVAANIGKQSTCRRRRRRCRCLLLPPPKSPWRWTSTYALRPVVRISTWLVYIYYYNTRGTMHARTHRARSGHVCDVLTSSPISRIRALAAAAEVRPPPHGIAINAVAAAANNAHI